MYVLPEVDDSQWPLVVSVMPPELGSAFLERYFARQLDMLAREQSWVHLVDLRALESLPDAALRNQLAEFTRRTAEASSRYTRGTALVHTSPLVRGIMTAIHWISPPSYDFASAGTTGDALTYLRERAVQYGFVLPHGANEEFVDGVVHRVSDLRRFLTSG